MNFDQVVSGLLVFAGGAGAGKFLDFLLKRKKQSVDTESILRAELSEQIRDLREQLAELKVEVDYWRDQYLELFKDYAELKARLDNSK